LLKLCTSLGLLAFLFFRMDLFRLYHIVASANPYLLVMAAGTLLTAKMVTAVRWALLARGLGFKNSLGQFFRYYHNAGCVISPIVCPCGVLAVILRLGLCLLK
jgi:hypothetical protein